MSELYFNARDWRRVGCSEQQIKFIEGLLDRVGGAETPSQDLTNLNATIAAQATNINALENAVEALTLQVAELSVNQPTTTNITEETEDLRQHFNITNSEVHRLGLRVQILEDAP